MKYISWLGFPILIIIVVILAAINFFGVCSDLEWFKEYGFTSSFVLTCISLVVAYIVLHPTKKGCY